MKKKIVLASRVMFSSTAMAAVNTSSTFQITEFMHIHFRWTASCRKAAFVALRGRFYMDDKYEAIRDIYRQGWTLPAD